MDSQLEFWRRCLRDIEEFYTLRVLCSVLLNRDDRWAAYHQSFQYRSGSFLHLFLSCNINILFYCFISASDFILQLALNGYSCSYHLVKQSSTNPTYTTKTWFETLRKILLLNTCMSEILFVNKHWHVVCNKFTYLGYPRITTVATRFASSWQLFCFQNSNII
jgi:hypothetical protein